MFLHACTSSKHSSRTACAMTVVVTLARFQMWLNSYVHKFDDISTLLESTLDSLCLGDCQLAKQIRGW